MAKAYKLRRGTVRLLENLLAQGEWYKGKGTRLAYHAGQILLNSIPQFVIPEDLQKDADAMMEYLSEEMEIALNNKQVRVCRKCVKFFVEKGDMNITRFLAELLDVLGMQPSDLDDDDLEDDEDDEEGEE